ncbi:MAG: asparagine synthetase B, partial [bacterium]|nr:asparagine synthetase B [bacterium]
KLEPGHYMVLENNRLNRNIYWNPDILRTFDGDYNEAREECKRLLEDAVKIRMISDVPLGAFLSGGIDSSAVVAFMAGHSKSPVKTFTIGFREDNYDERQYAEQVALQYGTFHKELVVTADYKDIVEDLLLNFDEPFGDASALPTHVLAKLTREHVTVALSGDGGDELFGGYKPYRYMLSQIGKTDRFPKLMKHAARMMLPFVPKDSYPGKRLWILAAGKPERFIDTLLAFRQKAKMELFHPDVQREIKRYGANVNERKAIYFRNGGEFSRQMLYSDFKHYLPDDILVKVDRATMLASLESRAPFLDHRLVEFAFTLPTQWKFTIDDSKIILKDLLRDYLPGDILDRKKMGFGVPLQQWFTTQLIHHYGGLLESPVLDRYFQKKTIKKYLDAHKSGRADHSTELWLILAFALWAQKH